MTTTAPAPFSFEKFFGATFAAHGWNVHTIDWMAVFVKKYKTAVGVREAVVSIRPYMDRSVGRVRLYVVASYDSEGRNVLDALATVLDPLDVAKFDDVLSGILTNAELRIQNTYAVKLWTAFAGATFGLSSFSP